MYEKTTSSLLKWVESHHQGNGVYLSNANHPIWGVMNHHLLPHTFHYYGIILSYLNLYNQLNNPLYLQKATEAGNALCSLQRFTGQFRYDTFEFNTPRPQGLTLIHDALPSIALLELYSLTKNERYLQVAKKNIAWFFTRLWNGTYLTGCVNQDLCAAEALSKLYTIKKKEVLKERATKLANIFLSLQIPEGNLQGGFIRGFHEKNIVIPWYDAKTARSYLHLSQDLNTESYHQSAIKTSHFLKKNLSKKGLTHWYRHKEQWKETKEPYLIAPSGEIYLLQHELNQKVSPLLLKTQQKDGSFPMSTSHQPPNLGWNQWMLLYLTSITSKESAI